MTEIPLSRPDISDLEIDAVVAVLKSSRLSLGPKMEEFEHRVAAYTRVPHALAVSSGTAGLHLCLCAMGIGEGDEVIVPSFTFIAAANAVRYVRGVPVFIDIEPTTLSLDPAQIEAAITPRTRAIMVVHTFGYPAEMDAILEIAHRHSLFVIEDACEAIGAEYKEQRVGSFGHAAVFAFYPNKQITTGEGGMIVTSDAALAREIKALRNQGRYDTDDWHQHSILGYNYRLSEINSALGCVQMLRLDEILNLREQVARSYNDALGSTAGIVLPPVAPSRGRVSWFVYVIRLSNLYQREDRDAIVVRMREEGIQCGRYFAPIHSQPAYAGVHLGRPLPVTESQSALTIALPFFTGMNRTQVESVAQTLTCTINAMSR